MSLSTVKKRNILLHPGGVERAQRNPYCFPSPLGGITEGGGIFGKLPSSSYDTPSVSVLIRAKEVRFASALILGGRGEDNAIVAVNTVRWSWKMREIRCDLRGWWVVGFLRLCVWLVSKVSSIFTTSERIRWKFEIFHISNLKKTDRPDESTETSSRWWKILIWFVITRKNLEWPRAAAYRHIFLGSRGDHPSHFKNASPNFDKSKKWRIIGEKIPKQIREEKNRDKMMDGCQHQHPSLSSRHPLSVHQIINGEERFFVHGVNGTCAWDSMMYRDFFGDT